MFYNKFGVKRKIKKKNIYNKSVKQGKKFFHFAFFYFLG